MKKGFTLVELLAVIVVLAVISLIIFPIVTSQINSSKKDLYDVQVDNIIRAAKDMVLDNPSLLDENHIITTLISIKDLKSTTNTSGVSYLEDEDIKNPQTGEIMNGTVIIKYDSNKKGYVYEYQEKSKDELSSLIVTPAAKTVIANQSVIYTNEQQSGLFEDVANGEYVFRGENPDNFIKIGTSLWRIVSIDKDSYVMKVAKTTHNVSSVWTNSSSDTNYQLSNTNLKMRTYLNSDFYNTLTDSIKENIITNSTFNIGVVSDTHYDFKTVMADEAKSTTNLNVGLLNVSDVLRATYVLGCRRDYKNATCLATNYLVIGKSYFLANTTSDKIWSVSDSESLELISPTSQAYVIPVVYLKATSEVQAGGDGTSSSPYILKTN